jgi:NAD(P)-dependent dehydrogenase (short-subunit alcohol dehydrogenase family)
MTEDFNNKTLIVTGAAGALGSAIVARFVEAGIRNVALVDLDEASLQQKASELKALAADRFHLELASVALDVTDHDAVQESYAAIAQRFGRIDIAVNNAGIVAPSARIHNVRPEDFRRVLEVNLMGIFNCLKASLSLMRNSGGGAIINTASVAGFTGWSHSSPYNASKAAVIQLTKTAAMEYAKEHIRVNCVSPGTFVTSFHANMPDGAMDGVLARHPLGRFGQTDEIAEAYVYLASSAAQWITGTNLVIDGGMSIG